ncbi:MAG TPA: hypothetical protein PLB32_16320 [Acidobacteriota bacterium]|nr:hypothetical protein [Acidobacteriota bacterium]
MLITIGIKQKPSWLKLKKFKILAGLAIFLVIGGLLVFWATWPHWYFRTFDISVCYGQQMLASPVVYRSINDNYIIDLRDQFRVGDTYLYSPQAQEIRFFNQSGFFAFWGIAFNRQNPPLSSPLGKSDVDPQISSTQDSIEFTSGQSVRIKIIKGKRL